MKKLALAFAVVVCAAMAQASIVKWSSTAVSFKSNKLGDQAVELWMVGVGGAENVLVDTRNTAATPAMNKGKLAANTGAGQAAYDYTSVIAGGSLWDAEAGDLGREYYMVIKYTDATDGKSYTYTSDAVASSGLSSSALGTVAFTFTDTIKESGTNGWVAESVPEPTSGLLMLLGMAGLALRRRRA